LTADQFVNKGPNRPAFSETLRAEALAALEVIDYVVINYSDSAVPVIEALKPAFYVKGPDYKGRPAGGPGRLSTEEATTRRFGGELVFTEDETFSSSALINRYYSGFSPEIQSYLDQFKSAYSIEDVLELIDKAKDLKVLVVGETIVDDYHYVEAIGKAGKEPVLVTKSQSSEQFAGGSVAIANQVAGFCKNVSLLSCLGSQDSYDSFIRGSLKSGITPHLIELPGRPTIRKLRYLDHYLLQKLFEIYFIDDDELQDAQEQQLYEKLKVLLPEHDLVIVADYGHGMLSRRAIQFICDNAKFLAVNTQANAGNRGLHTASKYPSANYLSLSEGELRLEVRKKGGEIKDLVSTLRQRIRCPLITVTRGKQGIMCFRDDGVMAEGPGLTQTFVDRIGSGDAVLSATAVMAALGADPAVLALVGNVAGSEAVKTVGHRSCLEAHPLKRIVSSLLK
jgi:rfaE bifunctional protein kinase chain/domain